MEEGIGHELLSILVHFGSQNTKHSRPQLKKDAPRLSFRFSIPSTCREKGAADAAPFSSKPPVWGQVPKHFRLLKHENTKDFLPDLACRKRHGSGSQKRKTRGAGLVFCRFCAGRGNRTLDSSLARTCSTTKPYPLVFADYTISRLIIQHLLGSVQKSWFHTSEGMRGPIYRARTSAGAWTFLGQYFCLC